MRILSAKQTLVFLFILTCTFVSSQTKSKAYLSYIEAYNQLAIIQQKEHGIPASITLAQGLLESGAGQSEFAKKSNNHFGIKCHDWTGDKVYHDDDSKGECFRKYDNVLASYEDHSFFLKNKSRYAFLFELSPTDYEGWAHGLKKAGYATDPTYAYKLISIIENYGLHSYDLVKGTDNTIADSKHSTEKNQQIQPTMGNIAATERHEVYKNNRVRYVVAQAGDSYSSIADEFDTSEKNLRAYNEVKATTNLNPGNQVYLQNKRNKSGKSYTTHVVREGETMYQIAQQYAIKTEKLYLLNNKPFSEGAKTGEVLQLR